MSNYKVRRRSFRLVDKYSKYYKSFQKKLALRHNKKYDNINLLELPKDEQEQMLNKIFGLIDFMLAKPRG